VAPPPRPQPHESRAMGLATSISPDFYSWLRAYFEFREFRDLQCCMHLLSTCVETSNTQSLPSLVRAHDPAAKFSTRVMSHKSSR